MTPDREEQLYKDMADVLKRLNDVEQKLNDMTDKLDTMDVLGFQNQLTSVDQKVKAMEARLLNVARSLYAAESLRLEDLARFRIHRTHHVPPLPPGLLLQRDTCEVEIVGLVGQAIRELWVESDRNSFRAMADALVDNINRCLKKYGFPQLEFLGENRVIKGS